MREDKKDDEKPIIPIDEVRLNKDLALLIKYGFVRKNYDNKYYVKPLSKAFGSFIINSYIFKKCFNHFKEENEFSAYISPNIHIFNHDPQINTIINANKKYSRKMKRIVNKFQDALEELNRLRKDIIQNNENITGYGFLRRIDGFSSSNKEKSTFTIVMHTNTKELIDLFFSKNIS